MVHLRVQDKCIKHIKIHIHSRQYLFVFSYEGYILTPCVWHQILRSPSTSEWKPVRADVARVGGLSSRSRQGACLIAVC